jgi:hypothetical protein
MISGLEPLGRRPRSKAVPVVMVLLDKVMKNSEARGWMCGRRMPQGPMEPRLMFNPELRRRGKSKGVACLYGKEVDVEMGDGGSAYAADAASLTAGDVEAVLLEVPDGGFD